MIAYPDKATCTGGLIPYAMTNAALDVLFKIFSDLDAIYCIDAPEFMPAGSCNLPDGCRLPGPVFIQRVGG